MVFKEQWQLSNTHIRFAVTMAGENDAMTFEDLSSAYRVEMKSNILAEARKDLYAALAGIQEKTQKDYEAEYSKDPDSIMCEGMNERRKKVNNLIQKVIDLRMEKVAMLALRGSMGANNVIEKLTQEERIYYTTVAEDSKKHRNSVLRNKGAKNYTIPDISPRKIEPMPSVPAPAPAERIATEHAGEELIESPVRETEEPAEELVTIRALENIPKFAGPDRDYELKKEDVVRLPAALAGLLINHEKAVRLNVTP
jgi:DNA replication factor GINS